MTRERITYSDEFKQKMVELYNSGKPKAQLIREYELTPSALSSWINKYNSTDSLISMITVMKKKRNLLNFVKKFNA